jgi:hypothetical protein
MESLQQASRSTYSALALEQSKSETMELLFLPQLVLHLQRLIYVLNSVPAQLFAHLATTSQ